MMYPLERFDKLEAHCILAEKYGFKSDFFAEKFLRILLQQKEKLERNRGHMHQIHQSTRELHLAKKFIIYSRLTKPKETIDELVGDLINPNIWPLLSDTEPHLEYYIIASSFGHFLYFIRSGILNITAGNYERRKIEKACLHANIRNNNRLYHQLIDDIRNISVHRNSLTLYHSSNWRQNAHARLLSLLELANYHHANLKRRAPQEASNFIQQFLAKTLGSSLFYNTLKQQLAYPGLLQSFMELMEEASLKNYPIQSRDLEAAKQLYRAQLTNITKGAEKPLFSYLYQ